ncbi:ArsR/SmtB family transcription factor [Desulfolithobacter dissulfuricans]|nr:metalloregulator ArsR/SmtB family transcription factor [Desulfolithobacter dissulfuricans]
MKNLQEVCRINCKSKENIRKAKEIIGNEHALQEVAEKLKLLGNATRLKIIMSLQGGELCVCELAEILQLSIPATSQQLKLLRQGGIVHLRNEGKTSYYSLAKQEIPAVIRKTFSEIFE